MIHFIKGQLDTVAEQQIVVENRGIGYEILVPASVIQKLPRIGNEVKIYTYMHVREDAMQLYGFMTKDEREMFQLLITVNGIGPKGALGILSIMDTDALRFAILSDDAKSISKAPGIGAKTASKLILELKDKVDFEEAVDTMLTQGEQNAAEAAAGCGISCQRRDPGACGTWLQQYRSGESRKESYIDRRNDNRRYFEGKFKIFIKGAGYGKTSDFNGII